MKVWLLRPSEGHARDFSGYDCADGFVIRAKTEERAREIAQEEGGDERHIYVTTQRIYTEVPAWTSPEWSTCIPLEHEGPEELIMRDFHAG